MFSRHSAAKRAHAASTGGALLYAIGDIHGRLDLLNSLITQIHADAVQQRSRFGPSLIFLGDYVDRGPDSRGVIDRILAIEQEAIFRVLTLKGNHEEQMLLFLEDSRHGPNWAEFGGAETLASYGVTPPKTRTDPEPWEEARLALTRAIPPRHLAFLNALEVAVVCGDYFFVHAGVRPGVPLEEQSDHDLLWIRQDFLNWDGGFGKIVVHGHTPESAPHNGHNRIGIDTGAYATGMLTAVRLCDADRFILQTGLRVH